MTWWWLVHLRRRCDFISVSNVSILLPVNGFFEIFKAASSLTKKREQKIKQDQVTTKLDIKEHIQFLVYTNSYAYDWGSQFWQETDCPSRVSNTSHTSGCVDGSRIGSGKNC